MKRLDGKVALITGAGSGIGRATAILFAREGAHIAVVDWSPPGGQETAEMIMSAGGKAVFIGADVSKAAEAESMVRTTVTKFGKLDILFNNAGIGGKPHLTADLPEDAWNEVLAVDLNGVFLGCKYAIREMLKGGGGSIISTASAAGISGVTSGSAYSVAKAGVINLTKTLALEYGGNNIRVNCICPGLIVTALSGKGVSQPGLQQIMKQQLLARSGHPDDIARAALYLASDDSSFVTGTSLIVDGGLLCNRGGATRGSRSDL